MTNTSTAPDKQDALTALETLEAFADTLDKDGDTLAAAQAVDQLPKLIGDLRKVVEALPDDE